MDNKASLRMGALGVASLLLAGCEGGDASKTWSAFATCLAGPAATSPVLERAQKLRQYQLASTTSAGNNDAWPKRCAAPADDLYASLDKSGKAGLLKRKLNDRLGCSEQKGSCKLPTDGALPTVATELWESAKAAELELVAVPGVAPPPEAPPPVVDAKSWKSFSTKPLRVAGPVLTSDGRALVVLKAAEGRSRPLGCEFAPGFAKVRCLAENPKVPELPPQSIDVVSDANGVYAAGLTDDGLVAYNLETGETSPVGGKAGRLVREGAVVERAAKDDITGGAPSLPTSLEQARALARSAKAKEAAKDDGFVVRELKNNKASAGGPLRIPTPVGDPIALGNQIVLLTPKEGGTNLVVVSVSNGRAAAPRTIEGAFAGTIHTCRRGDELAVAVFGGRKDQGRAQATAGEGKTAVTVTLYRDGAWSKAAEATIPFERATESDLVCTPNGASLTYAQKTDGGATIGRVDCTTDGCKASEAKLSGVEPTYFWTTGALGDKTMLLYRGALGETRLRVAALAELPAAKDTIVFDTPDYGGPTTGELVPLLSEQAALLVFRGEQPVALRVGADGAASVVSL